MSDWQPELYLKFEQERTQPVRDLLARVGGIPVKTAADLGCGPGNSTAELRKKFPQAHIVGLDVSAAMLAKARSTHPQDQIEWVQGDAARWCEEESAAFDLLFSNAAIQWMPNQRELLPGLFARLAPNGTFAAQIPAFHEMPANDAIRAAAHGPRWREHFEDFSDGMRFHSAAFYYDVLCGLADAVSLWNTDYFHIMPNQGAIVEMLRSSALRPYLDRLPEPERPAFLQEVHTQICARYETRADGWVLFPFKRMFFIARKKARAASV